MARVGWHCTACNRYFQSDTDREPDECRYCGATGGFRRIEHPDDRGDAAPEIHVGDTVAFEVHGDTREYVVGSVVAVDSDRIHVDAADRTGRYAVKPSRIVGVR